MAITVVRAATLNGNVTNHVCPFPDGIVTGDRLIVQLTLNGTDAGGWPAGWSVTVRSHNDGGVGRTEIGRRDVDGTEGFDGVGDSITVTTATSTRDAVHTWKISGHDAPTAVAIASDIGRDTPPQPNPPSLTPSWGAEAGTLWIAMCGVGFNDINIDTYPANYVDGQRQQESSGGASSANISQAAAERTLSAVSDDPGVFSGTGTTIRDWAAFTLAIRPSVAGGLSALLGTATETDAAQPLGRAKAEVVGMATETDAALAFGGPIIRTLAPALETDAALQLGEAKQRPLGPALESDVALPFTIPGELSQLLSPALEANTALGFASAKARSLSPALETELALSLVERKARLLGMALELDSAGVAFGIELPQTWRILRKPAQEPTITVPQGL